MPVKLPPKTEFKTLAFEVKSIDEEQGLITGYLSTFGNIDAGNDRVLKGAFKKTIVEAKSRMDNGRRYLWPCLWMHDPERPIGGYIDAMEDDHGLLTTIQLDISKNEQGIPNNPLAVMVFSGYKAGYVSEQSMGYNAIQKDYEQGVRNLKECRIVEGSAVTYNFAMNPEAIVEATGVKAMSVNSLPELEEKTVCGDTSLPIGPRDEHWHGTLAKKQIFAWAEDEEGNIDASKAKKCFLQVDGDTSLKGSYGYPFCYVRDGSPIISVGGVKAAASALEGSRGASTEGADIAGMRRKVEALYKRISEKYKDDPELVPPWSGKEKASDTPVNKKTFGSHFADQMCKDLLTDWQDVYLTTLTSAIMDALQSDDMAEDGVKQALDAFSQAVTGPFLTQANQYCLSEYIASHNYTYSPAASLMQNGSYGYMSRSDKPEGKAGARFSGTTKEQIQKHADDLRDMATQHKTMSDEMAAQYKSMTKTMKDHASMLEQKASDLTSLWQSEGQGDAYADNEDNTDSGTQKSNSQANSTKRREPSTETLTRTPTAQPMTITEDEELKALEAALAGWTKK